ncbi:MAG: hypothetical protein HQL41_00120 [Alphaproteobacteria bacterium]|nr:hypothetical protein [Alphaproteobacteria bacterium]
MSLAALEGGLTVRLRIVQGRIDAVTIANDRPLDAASALVGKPIADALRLVPLMFSLCGTAQLQAGLGACEAALGIRPSPAQLAARRLLLLAETVGEHGVRILRDWPALLGEPIRAEGIRALRGALSPLRKALYPDDDWAAPGGGRLDPDAGVIAACLTAVRAAARAAIADPSLPRVVKERGLADLCRSHPEPPETGPFARRRDHPLVAPLVARHGNGVLPRLVARLADLDECLAEMDRIVLNPDPGWPAPPHGDGPGHATLEAARGALSHHVTLTDGRIMAWRVEAPPEINFAPDGPLARGLIGPAGGDPVFLARLAVLALDPCVGCEVVVEGV